MALCVRAQYYDHGGACIDLLVVFFLFKHGGMGQAKCIRDGVKKSKWKFKMAFAMKGGRGLEGVSSAIYLF